jgi:prophage maintenance system killer protein
MDIYLYLNKREIVAEVVDQYEVIPSVASSRIDREKFTQWLTEHIAVSESH